MNIKKSVMLWILVALMIFSLVPVSVSAADDCTHEKYSVVSTLKEADCKNGVRGIQKLKCDACSHTWYAQYDGHTMVQDTIEATCTAPERVGEKCENCDFVGEASDVEGSKPLGHDMQLDTEKYKPATCDEGGLDTLKCSRCDYTEEKATEALGHNWNDIGVVEADCVNPAGAKQECANCKKTQIVAFTGDLAVAPKGHKPEAVADIAPTCKTPGLTGKTVCSVCGVVTNAGTEVPVAADAHKAVLATTLKGATCEVTGIGKYKCEYCDADLGYKIIPADHVWGEGVVTTEATCGAAGEKTYTCSVCQKTKTEVIPATGEHDWKDDYAEATCESPAMAGKICSKCEVVGADAAPVEGSAPLGHDMQLDTANEKYKSATCDEGGLDTLKCSRCDYTEEKATEALGHNWNDIGVVEADCVNPAGAKQECANCKKTQIVAFTGDLAVAPKGHKPEAVADIAPTCKTPGLTGKTVCSVCGVVTNAGTEVPVAADAHKAVLATTLKGATCEVTGIGKYKCEYCDADLGYKIIPADHVWGEGVVTTEATCGAAGEKTYTCSVCQKTKTEVIPATGEHDWKDDYAEATCESPAMAGKICSKCEVVGADAAPVEGSAPLGHDMQLDIANEKYKPATCDEGGLDTLKCSRCAYTEEKATEALGHNWNDIGAVEADCVNPAGAKQECANCKKTQIVAFTGDLAVAPKGHKPEAVADVAPTCKTPGLTGKTVCSVCGVVTNAGTEVPVAADAHKAVLATTLKEATCTTTGIGKYKCEYCDADLGYKIITVQHIWGPDMANSDGTAIFHKCDNCDTTEVIVAFEGFDPEAPLVHTHNYEAAVTEPTCEAGGYTTYTCACGDTYTDDAVDALGHTWNDGEVTTEATEEAEGVMTYTCTVCEATKTEAIPALNHTHNYVAGEVTAPTCETKGYTTYTCACGDTYTADEVDALGHTATEAVVENAVDATCEVAGSYDEVVYCSVCEAEISRETIAVDALEHTWNNGEITTEPTEEAEGVMTYTCTVCEATKTESIPVLGHSHSYEAAVTAPTCETKGYTTYTCACGDTYTADEVDALGHNHVAGAVTAPTCETKGYTTYTCACGDTYTADEVNALGHDYSITKYVGGRFIRFCSRCNKQS